jgi:uncharacterized protein (DUF433 family)
MRQGQKGKGMGKGMGTDTLEAGNSMAREFIERRETGFYITGSRVPIDRIIWEYRNGEDPEAIRAHYPTLSVEQVNGAIAFYHHHKEEVKQALEERRLAEDAYTSANPNPPISNKSSSACGGKQRRGESDG